MTVQVCWFNIDVTPSDVFKGLGTTDHHGARVWPMFHVRPAKEFDDRNHRWMIECFGTFEEAMLVARDLIAFLWFKFQISAYRILIEDDELRLEDPSVAGRLMNRVDSLENTIREEIGKLKKSRRIAGSKTFQSIREELERALFSHPHGWRPPSR